MLYEQFIIVALNMDTIVVFRRLATTFKTYIMIMNVGREVSLTDGWTEIVDGSKHKGMLLEWYKEKCFQICMKCSELLGFLWQDCAQLCWMSYFTVKHLPVI